MRKIVALSALLAAAAFELFAAATGYHVLKEIRIGGEGGWDYAEMDSAGRRLYVSHATHVVIVDPDAAKVVGVDADRVAVLLASAHRDERRAQQQGEADRSDARVQHTCRPHVSAPLGEPYSCQGVIGGCYHDGDQVLCH